MLLINIKKLLKVVSKTAFSLSILLNLGGCTPKTNQYALTTVVVNVEKSNNLVTARDFNGNFWQFYAEDYYDFCRGDIASLLMDDNGTPKIYDDIILKANYDGWMDEFMTYN